MPNYHFSPRSIFWRVNSDFVINLGLARALLLEIAHPMVAAGVIQHSNYDGDRYGRLIRTLQTITGIMFSDQEGRRDSLRHFHGCHAKVSGQLPENAGVLPAGTHYTASDPILKLWVMATALDSYLRVYEMFAAPLSLEDKETYYQDSLRLGQLFGIPLALMPADYEAFNSYMQTMFDSDILTVSESAHKIARTLFRPRLAYAGSFVSIGLLPSRIRNEFGFEWGEKQQQRLQWLAKISRRAKPLVPRLVAANPRAVLAEWRFWLSPASLSL